MLRLINFWLAMLVPMFAAAPVVPAAGGSEAAPAPGGESAAPVEADLGTEDTAELETPAEGVEEAEVEAAPDAQQDTRVLTGPVRKVLAELKTNNPEAYKQLKGVLFAEREFRTLFPQGPQQARELSAKLDEMGGVEGLDEVATEVQDYRQLDEQWINGDPQFIETAVENFPDGFKKLMPRMLATYAKVDQEGYNRELSRVIVSTFGSSGVNQALAQVRWLLSRSTDDAAKEALAQVQGIEKWVSGLGEMANKQPVQAHDPRNQELDQRERTIAQKEQDAFNTGLSRTWMGYATEKIGAELKSFLNGKQLSPDAQRVISRDVNQAVWDTLLKDSAWVRKYESLCDNRDDAGAMKLLESKVETKDMNGNSIMSSAVKRIYRGLYGQPAKKTGAAPSNGNGKPQPAAPKGWTRVTAPPKVEDVASSTTMEQKYNSMAILKNGSKVYWGDKVPA